MPFNFSSMLSCASQSFSSSSSLSSSKSKILVVFFTRKVSLDIWFQSGLLSREKMIYECYLESNVFDQIFWLTYGSEDIKVRDHLVSNNLLDNRIKVLQMPSIFKNGTFASFLYSLIAPLIHYTTLSKASLFKTNQVDGAWTACLAHFLFAKPLVTRAGYLPSLLYSYSSNRSFIKQYIFAFLEYFVFRIADAGIVTSSQALSIIGDRSSAVRKKIHCIPNYIDTLQFYPYPVDFSERKHRVLYVGRFSPEKNLFSLIAACNKCKIGLDLIGYGESFNLLSQFASSINADVLFLNRVQNSSLPAIYNSYKFFALTSFSEGLPKALLEAMACGCICIGTNVSGISEVIIDNRTGYLANETDCDSIATTLTLAVNKNHMNIIHNCRSFIESSFSLQQSFASELRVIESLILDHSFRL